MALEDQIDDRAREIHADGYAMSLGEVMNLYRDGDLEIHPEFQRIFRWSRYQQSRLIESIFLGIPIPPVFVAQRDDGVWDVVDGVQRLSTILRFAGILRDANGNLVEPEPLLPTEYLPLLSGITFDNEQLGTPLPAALRRDFKRSKLEFSIIKKESDPAAKYDLFQRLNSGTHLSEQEARNCLLVMLDASLYEWLASLARTQSFLNTAVISDRKEEEQYGLELVLRFLVALLKDPQELAQHMVDVSSYLDGFAIDLAESETIDFSGLEQKFTGTFDVLDASLGDDSFRRFSPERQRHLGGFSISAFEVVAAGVALNLDRWRDALTDEALAADLADRARGIWTNQDFQERTGSGVRGSDRIPHTLTLARQIFS